MYGDVDRIYDPGIAFTRQVRQASNPTAIMQAIAAAGDGQDRRQHFREALILAGIAVALLGAEKVINGRLGRRTKQIHQAGTAATAAGALASLARGLR